MNSLIPKLGLSGLLVVVLAQAGDAQQRTAAGTAGYNSATQQYYTVYSGYIKVGGTASWRNNNPGNIRFANQATAIGQSLSGFAIFPTEATGTAAMLALLQSPSYQALTLNGAIARWAPATENQTAVYQAFVSRQTGIPGTAKMNTLNAQQIAAIGAAIRQMEGWTPGLIYLRGDTRAPAWVQALLR